MDNPYFNKAKEKAGQALKDKPRMGRILTGVTEKLNKGSLSVSKIGEKVMILVRMVKAYVSGNYRIVPWKSIIIISAVLIYFLMPLDLIADFIPITGYIDDFSLILWTFSHLQDDINTFVWWEENENS